MKKKVIVVTISIPKKVLLSHSQILGRHTKVKNQFNAMNIKTRFVNVSIVSEARDISVFKATKNVLDRLELFRFPGEGTALSNKRNHIRISSLNMSQTMVLVICMITIIELTDRTAQWRD